MYIITGYSCLHENEIKAKYYIESSQCLKNTGAALDGSHTSDYQASRPALYHLSYTVSTVHVREMKEGSKEE